MNKNQKIVLWVGIIFILLMATFPPVKETRSGPASRRIDDDYSNGVKTWETVKYRFILDTEGGTVLLSNLFVQWVVVSIISGGLVYALGDKNSEKRKEIVRWLFGSLYNPAKRSNAEKPSDADGR